MTDVELGDNGLMHFILGQNFRTHNIVHNYFHLQEDGLLIDYTLLTTDMLLENDYKTG